MISIEHDKEWWERVSSVVYKKGISNCKLVLCEPKKNSDGVTPWYDCQSYTSKLRRYEDISFENYARSIEEYPEGYFDLVFVDGELRPSCIFHALSKIRPGGYLMLDNSDNPQNEEAISLLAGYRGTDFLGIGPFLLRLWQTSVWQINCC